MPFSLSEPIVVGALSAAVVNYLADILPQSRWQVWPACPHCGAAFSKDTYLLGRPCPECNHKREPRTAAVMAAMLSLSLLMWVQPPTMGFFLGMLLVSYLALVFVIDLEHCRILRSTNIAGGVLAIILGTIQRGLLPTLLGGLSGFGTMWVVYRLGFLYLKIRGHDLESHLSGLDHKGALGFGDVRLAVVLGFALGWPLVWESQLLGAVLGGLFGLAIVASTIIRRRPLSQALKTLIPYGPPFIIAAYLILFLPGWIGGLFPW